MVFGLGEQPDETRRNRDRAPQQDRQRPDQLARTGSNWPSGARVTRRRMVKVKISATTITTILNQKKML